MLARIKNNERNYDIRHHHARDRSPHSIGYSRDIKGSTIDRAAYVSFSDWALHRSRRLGCWRVYGAALRHKFLTPWHSSPRSAYGESGRIRLRDGRKNLARHEMKQFLIEQIPVLFFIAAFFLMLALEG